MKQVLEITAKYSKGDHLFALKEGADREPDCLIAVTISGISHIKFLGTGVSKIITYSARTSDKNISIEVAEDDLYSGEEVKQFLK